MKTLSEPVTIYNTSIPVITRLPILSAQHTNQSDIRTVMLMPYTPKFLESSLVGYAAPSEICSQLHA
jgi:hypothetical protein